MPAASNWPEPTTQASALAAHPGAAQAGPLPPSLHLLTAYVAAALVRRPVPEGARVLEAFLGDEAGALPFRAGGFER